MKKVGDHYYHFEGPQGELCYVKRARTRRWAAGHLEHQLVEGYRLRREAVYALAAALRQSRNEAKHD